MALLPEIHVRPATHADRAQIISVEAKSTPGLRYVPEIFDLFMDDARGEFLVAEMAGEVVACGKFTVVPDGSAWLETLRVIPERQGLGIGKRFYERFVTLAQREGVTAMRMYTGTKNLVSKGLAERFGFQPAETFYGAGHDGAEEKSTTAPVTFQPVTDGDRAATLLLPHAEAWHHYLVMNRTFYRLSPALCTMLAAAGQVYEEAASGSVIALGARFMPEQALHIGMFGGDTGRCLQFAQQQAEERGVPRVSCLFPTGAVDTKQGLTAAGFQTESAAFIVMEVTI